MIPDYLLPLHTKITEVDNTDNLVAQKVWVKLKILSLSTVW